MKKIYGTLLVLLMLPAALSARDVIDGRILVASEGELPQGLFAKAAGYLPGDTIAVTNPASGLTVDVLNLGTLDYEAGVTVIISEEAASALGVSAAENLNAELSLRGGVFDEAFSGTARIARNIVIPEVPVQAPEDYEDSVESDDDFLSEKRAVEQPSPAELQEYADGADGDDFEPYDEQDPGAVPRDEEEGDAGGDGPLEAFEAESAAAAETEAESPAREEPPAEEEETGPGYEKFDAESAPQDAPAESERPADKDDENEPEADFSDEEMYRAAPEPEKINPDEVPALYPVTEAEEVGEDSEDVPNDSEGEEVEPSEEVTDEEPEKPVAEDLPGEEVESCEDVECETESEVSDDVPGDSEGEAVEPSEEVTDEETERPVAEDLPGEEVEPCEDVECETESEVSDDVPNDSEGEAVEPSEEVTDEETERPVAEDLPGESVEPCEDVEEEGDIQGILGEPQVEIPEEDGAYAPIVLVPADSRAPEDGETDDGTLSIQPEPAPVSAQRTAIEARTVREQDLQKGSYYVQIATMTRAENINELLETYSKYPVVLVPAAGGAYRVLVGPLSVDEYGVVLAKFRAFGFKDAFLRHIK